MLNAFRGGCGEPVLLIHGIGASHVDFSAVLAPLSEHLDVIAIDLPGHGTSPALARRPTVSALANAVEKHLDTLGLDRVHIVGNSLGGRVALELAARGRASSVVAIAPSGLADAVERPLQSVALAGAGIGLRTVRRVAPALTSSALGRTAVLAGMRARPWQATRAEADAILSGFGTRSYWSTLLWSTVFDLPQGLWRIRCPVHLIQGSNDLLAGAQLMRYAAVIRGAQCSILPFAGHAAQGDRPGRIVDIVRATVERAAHPGRGDGVARPQPKAQCSTDAVRRGRSTSGSRCVGPGDAG